MFYNYLKLEVTKNIKDYEKVKCVLISQEMMDYSVIHLMKSKNVKLVINCVDTIYDSPALVLLNDYGIRIVYMNKKYFEIFDRDGLVFIDSHRIWYKTCDFPMLEPRIKNIFTLKNDFITNTIQYMNKEKELAENIEIISNLKCDNDSALIVSRNISSVNDLKSALYIIRKYKPYIIAIDGGCDILLDYGIKPNLVIGDMDSISEESIEKCNFFILHSYLDGNCPAARKIPKDKISGYIKCIGISEDAAILFCVMNNIKKIYTLGYHLTACDFLEKGRHGMSSSIIVRMLYGDRIVDIKNSEEFIYHKTKISIMAVLIFILNLGFYTGMYAALLWR